jgi:hypothetical protein
MRAARHWPPALNVIPVKKRLLVQFRAQITNAVCTESVPVQDYNDMANVFALVTR